MPSRPFLAALAGVAMTLFAWFGPWAWPAWPAFAVMDVAFGARENFGDLPYAARAIWMTVLIVVNVGAWAAVLLVAYAGLSAARRNVLAHRGR